MIKVDTEEVVLRYGNRGMDLLVQNLPRHFYRMAAESIMGLSKGNVLILTGFYVAGHPETDGPTGAYFLAKAFERLGFTPVILTDGYVGDLFREIETVHIDSCTEDICGKLLKRYAPVFCLSIEYCGRNSQGDYTNMRGISIREHISGLDAIILAANDMGIPTFGIGDGGNEVGMGNLHDRISGLLPIEPSIVPVDHLMIATVSNWAAYGLIAELQKLASKRLMPTYEDIKQYYRLLISEGCVDGISRECKLSVDGFPIEVERGLLADLMENIG